MFIRFSFLLMKKYIFFILSLLLLLPASALWVPRGVSYVWVGDDAPDDAPADMLTGAFYDYNRAPDGDYYTYSNVYGVNGKMDAKTAVQAKRTGAINPTGGPDFSDVFAKIGQQFIQGRTELLKQCYKLPFAVATPHIYMAPSDIHSIEAELDAGGRLKSSQSVVKSDIIIPSDAGPRRGVKGRGRAELGAMTWVAVFKGRVIAPKSMTFRFVGTGDECILVRFNGELVLEGGYVIPSRYRGMGVRDSACNKPFEYGKEINLGKIANRKDYQVIQLKSTPICNRNLYGVMAGCPITVKKGKSYPIEIMIGNRYVWSACYLLTQEISEGGEGPLQLFRTNVVEPTRNPSYHSHAAKIEVGRKQYITEQGPLYDPASPVWKIAPKESKKKTNRR